MKTISFRKCQWTFWNTDLRDLPFGFKSVRSAFARTLPPGAVAAGPVPCPPRPPSVASPSPPRQPGTQPWPGSFQPPSPPSGLPLLFLFNAINSFPSCFDQQTALVCCHQEVSLVHTAHFVSPKPTVGLIGQHLVLEFPFQSIMLRSCH